MKRTIYVKGFDKEKNQCSGPELDDLMNFFNPHGDIENIHVSKIT